jgi:hypothetical protein
MWCTSDELYCTLSCDENAAIASTDRTTFWVVVCPLLAFLCLCIHYMRVGPWVYNPLVEQISVGGVINSHC